MEKLYVKWEGMEEVNKPNMVIVVPSLRGYLLALGSLKKEKVSLRKQLTVQFMSWYLMIYGTKSRGL